MNKGTGIRTRDGAGWAKLLLSLMLLIVAPARLHAQNPNQFGGQDRADAAARMIVLGVQQGISSLPPTTGQSFSYQFDDNLGVFVASDRLGPTSFRSPQTMGPGKLSLRVATSYFELADSLGPIPYRVDLPLPGGSVTGLAELGLDARAQVGSVNLAATYGVTDRIDVTLNLPIVTVDAQAFNVFTTDPNTTACASPSPTCDPVSGPNAPSDDPELVAQLQPTLNQYLTTGKLVFRKYSFRSQEFDFNDGTHAGIGRINLGAKATLYANKAFTLAGMTEFFFPSPSEAQFAGSDSAAILPRLIGQLNVADPFRLHIDAGYDYDFSNDELRRFTWNVGASIPLSWATFDFGIGGSKFNQGIKWTPDQAAFVSGFEDDNGDKIPGTVTAQADNRLGDNFIDFLVGLKFRLTEHWVISGAVNVPANNEGFRPAAVGTLALEFYL